MYAILNGEYIIVYDYDYIFLRFVSFPNRYLKNDTADNNIYVSVIPIEHEYFNNLLYVHGFRYLVIFLILKYFKSYENELRINII